MDHNVRRDIDNWLHDANRDLVATTASEIDVEVTLARVKQRAAAQSVGEVDATQPLDVDTRLFRRLRRRDDEPSHFTPYKGGDAAELIKELKTLRKGRGLFVRELGERVGPVLREVCNVLDVDGPGEIRRKASQRLETLASRLPEDLNVALLAAFALHADARLPFYQDRVRWTAQRLNRDDRGARRRIDEAIERVAELAMSSAKEATTATTSTTDWYTDELEISLILDQLVPEAFEFRRIVADRDQVSHLDLATTLTADSDRKNAVIADALHLEVFYGGWLVSKYLESTDRFKIILELPKPLNRAAKHDIALRYRMLPRGGHMQPHYVCVPKHRCNVFDLHVRFDPNKMPARIWRLTDAFQHDVDDPTPNGEIVTPDDAGEVHATFRHLTPGLAYGLRWAM